MVKSILFSVILGCLIVKSSFSQNSDCKVLLNGLEEQYDGSCKKGLAHGEGTAKGDLGEYVGGFRKGFPNGFGKLSYKRTMVDGSYYEGDWQRGKRNGEGTYYFSKDSIIAGFWADNIYLGKYPYPFKVLSSQAIPRNKFVKNEKTGITSIEIQFKRQGIRTMADIVSMEIQISSGSDFRQQNYLIVENVDFPFEARLTMIVTNRLKSNTYSANFAFLINEEANWIVSIDY